MRNWKALLLATASVMLLAAAGPASAGPYYKGKTVTLIVPNSVSGKMSQYARMIVPYIAKHLGAADVRIRNEQGAGGLKGSNHLWNIKPDGMTFAFTNVPALITAQLAGSPGVRFDATKFTYLGRVAAEPRVMVVGAGSSIKSAADLKTLKRPFIYASQGTDEDFYTMATLAHTIGYQLKIVTGYKGNADTRLAVIKGDADGQMTGWVASKAAVKAGDMRVILVMTTKRLEELPKVPTALELVKDPKKQQSLKAISTILAMSRGFFGPPKMNATATKEMRAAITAALHDPKMLAEAKKRGFPIVPAPGAVQQEKVKDIVAASGSLTPIFKAAVKSIR